MAESNFWDIYKKSLGKEDVSLRTNTAIPDVIIVPDEDINPAFKGKMLRDLKDPTSILPPGQIPLVPQNIETDPDDKKVCLSQKHVGEAKKLPLEFLEPLSEVTNNKRNPICRSCYFRIPEQESEASGKAKPTCGRCGNKTVAVTHVSNGGSKKLCTACFNDTEGVMPEALSKKDFITVSVARLLDKLQPKNPGNENNDNVQ